MSESNANTAALCVRFLIPRNTARPMTGGGVSEVMTSQGHLVSLPPPHTSIPPPLTQHLLFSCPLQAEKWRN